MRETIDIIDTGDGAFVANVTEETQGAAARVPEQPLGISHRPSPCRELFAAYEAQDKPAFIGYLPFGFPDPDLSLEAFRTMVDNGTDIVEIGLPYSDPVMDGPVIQAASQIALRNGERIADVFKAVETVANAGGAGLITPDLIPDEAGEWIEAADRHGLDRIFLVSPDSTNTRLRVVAENTRGFVYAAARMGVTGERATLNDSPQELVARTRAAGAENVCVGIGVSTPVQGATVGRYADGVIVGSALVHTFLDENGAVRDPVQGLGALANTTAALADAIHGCRA